MQNIMNMNEFNEIKNFGTGSFSLSPYDTAWVASIPSPTDPTQPAFPKSLQWLRQNQLPDGSWGTTYPKSIYDMILNTASAIVCLKKWERYSDKELIESGLEAYKRNISNTQIQIDDSIGRNFGFEILLCALVDRALELGIDLNNEVVEKLKREAQFKFFIIGNMKKGVTLKSSALLTTLEGCGTVFDKSEFRELVDSNGLIGNSYSATAFAVITDPSLKECFDTIERAIDMNDGAVPVYYPMEVFGLAWSMGFLWMSGIDITENKFKRYIDTLESYWHQSNGHLGGGKTLEPDPDSTSYALFVLNSAGKLIDVQNCRLIIDCFRGNHFFTLKYEPIPSLTTNLHCILSLKTYKQNNEIKVLIEKTLKWIRAQMNTEDKYLFRDIWHFSPFYPLSRVVISLEGIDDELCQMCVNQIIQLQHTDGGWGLDSISSLEETSHCILAISYWLRSGHKMSCDKEIQSIERGKHFIETTNDRTLWPLWIMKTLYCITDVVETLIYSAKNSKY